MKRSRLAVAAVVATLIHLTVFAQEGGTSGQTGTPANPPPTSSTSTASPGKIAVINTGAFSADDGIAQLVAQLKRVNEQFKERNAKIESIKQRGQALQTELDTQGPNLTPKARADKQEMLEDLKSELQTEQQKFERDYTKAVREATDPVVERVNAFLDNYCKQRGIVLVLEAAVLYQARGLAYVDATLDITRDFIDAYNKSTGASSTRPSSGSSSGSPADNPATQKSTGTSNARPPAPKKP